MKYLSEIKAGERIYKVEYEVSRKLASSARIKKGKVVLKLSRFLFGRKKDEVIEKFLNWAQKRLSKVSVKDFVLPVYKDGGRVFTHNKIYELSVNFSGRKNVKAVLNGENTIQISMNEKMDIWDVNKKIRVLAENIILEDQESYLKEVVNELNQLYFQEKYNVVRFKKMNSRFGSCSSKRNINIAFRLLFAPREVFRYVCVHELAHLKEFNHSKRFWILVKEACPDFKESERWLKSSGFMLG